jgi:hypothetical protein
MEVAVEATFDRLSETTDAEDERVSMLQLSAVKKCKDAEASRPYTFEVISPMSRIVLQAHGPRELEEWTLALERGIAQSLESGGTGTDAKVLETLRQIPGNDKCADCDLDEEPTWASINLGIMLCLRCCGAHRALGVSVSKVRSATLDSWPDATIEFMKTVGNTKSNAVYEHLDLVRLSGDSTQEETNAHVVDKYVDRKFSVSAGDHACAGGLDEDSGLRGMPGRLTNTSLISVDLDAAVDEQIVEGSM